MLIIIFKSFSYAVLIKGSRDPNNERSSFQLIKAPHCVAVWVFSILFLQIPESLNMQYKTFTRDGLVVE